MENENKINNIKIDNQDTDSDDLDYSSSSIDSNSISEEKDNIKKIEEKEKEEMSEQEKISEKILKKWTSLQKIIKEEITLEEVIVTRYKEDYEKFKKFYNDYYETKLYFRTNFEEMKNFKRNGLEDLKKNCLDREGVHQILIDTYEPIKNLLFIFRTNYEYVIKLISLIDNKDNEEKVESLVELFCNQFYENIFIPNPEQKELLLLIFLLIQNEVQNMDNAFIDEFLDNKNFLGKFISSYVRRQEMNTYLSMLLTPLINSIENVDKECIDISLNSIQKYIFKKHKEQLKLNSNDNIKTDKNIYDYNEKLYDKIPKSSLIFKKNYELDIEKEEEENRVEKEMDEYELNSDKVLPKIVLKNMGINKITITENKLEIKKEEYNNEYKNDLNTDKLLEILNNTKDENFKEYILSQIDQLYLDSDIFTNKGLISYFEEYNNDELKNLIIGKYKRNFLYIQKKIENLLQSIIDKISTVPYTIRCICKIIYLLMSKKFINLPKYYINSFVGKFFFGKYIFPVLSLEYKNILNNRIFSNKNKKCINFIISVIEKAFKGELFQTQVDTEKTIFNHYLIEIFPIIDTFFEKLIDIELPKIIEKSLNETEFQPNNSIFDEIFDINKDENKIVEKSEINDKNIENKEENSKYKYDYFTENSDEILHLQSICFSLNDILFILSLISKNLKIFSDLPKYSFFCKTFEHIKSKDYKIDDQIDKEPDTTKFYILFKEEKIKQLEKLVSKKKKEESSFLVENQNSDLICKRVKLSIKTVLKGLNLLNNKDFSHLIGAVSNEKFFSALQYTLDDLENFSENMNQIPLKWYGLYLSNNKKRINEKYQQNDYEMLYEEMLEEESKILEELKKFSRILITRNGMNLGCGEKILEQMNIGIYHMKQAKKIVMIEKFVNTEIIEVCIQISKENEDKNISNAMAALNKDNPNIIIIDAKDCPHNKTSLYNLLKTSKKRHCYYIKDIIKFILNENLFDNNNPNEIEELKIQNRNKLIYKFLVNYMKFVTEKIKNPIVNKNIFLHEKNNLSTKEKEKYYGEIRRKIGDYILKKLYRYVYPSKPIGFDDKFYDTTRCLDWVTPELLTIKKEYINQLGFAELCLKRMEEAISVNDKLEWINNAVDTVICTVKFSGDKEININNEEMVRIFMYILIKAQLRRVNSNINYIQCFAEDEVISDKKEDLFHLMDNAVINVLKINSNYLKMSDEEFNTKFEDAKKRYCIEKV